MMKDRPTTLYIYPESDDIDAVAQAVKAGRSPARAGLYWNASCLREIGAPKFWPKETLEPILIEYKKDHPSRRRRSRCRFARGSNPGMASRIFRVSAGVALRRAARARLSAQRRRFDARIAEAVELVKKRRHQNGRWPLGAVHPDRVTLDMEAGVGKASRWNTLRALRVLDRFGG